MNREIKFRIYLQHEETGTITSQDFTYAQIFEGFAKRKIAEMGRYYVIGKVEFTGLHDKNGEEIFEGDILSDKAVVEWFNKLSWDSGGSMHPGFYAKRWVSYDYEDGEYELSYHDSFRDVEVIGNIFESPELIEK